VVLGALVVVVEDAPEVVVEEFPVVPVVESSPPHPITRATKVITVAINAYR
jgi:hypothetical protein